MWILHLVTASICVGLGKARHSVYMTYNECMNNKHNVPVSMKFKLSYPTLFIHLHWIACVETFQ